MLTAIDAGDKTETADQVFSLAVTLAAVRDWIVEEKPGIKQAAHALYPTTGERGRITDLANVSKHRVRRRPGYSDPALGASTITAGGQMVTVNCGGIPTSAKTRDMVVTYWPKHTLIDGTKFVESERAIQALEVFLTSHGL